jgi:hypothetical protein
MTRTLNVFVPGVVHRTDVDLLAVLTVWGTASGPKVHSYRKIVDVAPVTFALTMTLVFTVAVCGAVIVTEGGCAGSTTTLVETGSEKPLASVATAWTV